MAGRETLEEANVNMRRASRLLDKAMTRKAEAEEIYDRALEEFQRRCRAWMHHPDWDSMK